MTETTKTEPYAKIVHFTEQQIDRFCEKIDNLCLNEGPTGHEWSMALQIIRQLQGDTKQPTGQR